jgi:hypothetical protein
MDDAYETPFDRDETPFDGDEDTCPSTRHSTA